MSKNTNQQFGENAFQQMDELSNTSRRYFEAVMKSSEIMAKGAQDMAQSYVQMVQEIAEKNNAAMRGMMSSKSLDELSEGQNAMMQQGLQEAMTTMTKISEAGVKVVMEAGEPLSQEMAADMSKATQAAAQATSKAKSKAA